MELPANKAPVLPGTDKAVVIKLVEPIIREGGTNVDTLTLRKPNAGELRGLKVPEVVNGDVNTVIALLPRIASPVISQDEAETLNLEDFGEITGAIYGFFMNREAKAKIAQMMGG
ncbi:phage tail assembly protein [Sphingomonas sp. S-NIH.Pt3_0716]|nr:phage tail assembly protein [Sphingomonas sp. S-NIH.Pt3_0716]